MTEKEMIEIKHGSENMVDLLNQEQAELKKAMIKEMAEMICGCASPCDLDEFTVCDKLANCSKVIKIAKALQKVGYRRVPEGAIVLTEGEYSDLLFDEVATLKRDIAEYWANADFENVVKELHKNGYRKLDDHAIFVLRKAKSLEEKVRKETAREILNKVDYESNGQTKQITDLLRRKYGVEVE